MRNVKERKKKSEAGYMVDMLGSLLVFMFLIASLFAYMSYSRLTQMRLSIDNIAKAYLYSMEESGGFTPQMQSDMTEELQEIGCIVDTSAFQGTIPHGNVQAAYGDRVTLDVIVSFPNPLWENLSRARHPKFWFVLDMTGNTEYITYHVKMSSTARW